MKLYGAQSHLIDRCAHGEETAMRQYIRHPSDIPIEIIRGRQSLAQASSRIHDVSYGGLALKSSRELEPGIVVEVRIPCVRPVFTTKARVAWCRAQSDGFELGV